MRCVFIPLGSGVLFRLFYVVVETIEIEFEQRDANYFFNMLIISLILFSCRMFL